MSLLQHSQSEEEGWKRMTQRGSQQPLQTARYYCTLPQTRRALGYRVYS